MKYKKPYEEQFARIKRLYKSLEPYKEATNENFYNGIDAFTSFFIQCYHMADWLKKSGYSEKIIYKYIKESPYLSLIHELANVQKHGKPHSHGEIKNSKYCDFGLHDVFGVTTPISRHYDYFDKGKVKFCLHASDFGPFPLDAIELAYKSIEEWQNFINSSTTHEF